MELSDKDAILLVVHALPTADIWHEISPEEVRTIFQQASRELARLESVELSSGLTMRPADLPTTCPNGHGLLVRAGLDLFCPSCSFTVSR